MAESVIPSGPDDPESVVDSTPSVGEAWRADRARYGRGAWRRELSLYAIAIFRFGQWVDTRNGLTRLLLARVYWLLHRWACTTTHVELPKGAAVGPGIRIFHSGPVVVHPESVIGAQCTLRHGVTIGERAERGGTPVIGDDVQVGAFAQVLGPVRIGDGARIGAMALVIDDMPPGGVALAPRAEIRPGS